MDSTLREGITAAKNGDKSHAFDLLTRAVQDASTAEQAWLWLSSVVEEDSERLFCLNNVLRSNPAHAAAQRGASVLRARGILPAVPAYPAPAQGPAATGTAVRSTPATQASAGNPASAAQIPARNYGNGYANPSRPQTGAVTSGRTDLTRQESSGLYKYAAMELVNKKAPRTVEMQLVNQGTSPDLAHRIVTETRQELNQARSSGYKKRMLRGLLWTFGGIAVTCGTIAFSDKLGGSSYIFYGAILYGVIDFIRGLWGWMTSR